MENERVSLPEALLLIVPHENGQIDFFTADKSDYVGSTYLFADGYVMPISCKGVPCCDSEGMPSLYKESQSALTRIWAIYLLERRLSFKSATCIK